MTEWIGIAYCVTLVSFLVYRFKTRDANGEFRLEASKAALVADKLAREQKIRLEHK